MGEHTFGIFAFPGSCVYAHNNPNSRARHAGICISGITHTSVNALALCARKREERKKMLLHNRAFYNETLSDPIPSPIAELASGKIFRVLSHLSRDPRLFSAGPVTLQAHAREDRVWSVRKRSSAIASFSILHRAIRSLWVLASWKLE